MDVSALDWITLGIAAGGFALACLSLGWQAATFVLSGERVKVELKYGGLGTHGAILWPADKLPTDLTAGIRSIVEQGYPEEVLAVEARNVGRLFTSVTGWITQFENGLSLRDLGDRRNPSLPYLLQPGHNETWYAKGDDIRRVVDTSRATGMADERGLLVWIAVELGSGKTLPTKQKLRIG